MSFLILIVLVFGEMIMPLADVNFTNAAVIQDFERQCTLMEQGRQFFESATPLGDHTQPWIHGTRCQQNQCLCLGGILAFSQFAELEQILLSSDDRKGDKANISIKTSGINTAKGIRNFPTLFRLQNTQSMTAAFGIGDSSSRKQSSNILFGGCGIITQTWQSLRSLLNDLAYLI